MPVINGRWHILLSGGSEVPITVMTDMPAEWMEDLPAQLATYQSLLAGLTPGFEKNYMDLQVKYVKAQITIKELEWEAAKVRGAEFMKMCAEHPKIETKNKRPSAWFEEISGKLDQLLEMNAK